jgi:hypothetical protein
MLNLSYSLYTSLPYANGTQDFSAHITLTPRELPSALTYLNLTAAQMQHAQLLTLTPFTFPGANWDYRAKVDDGDGYTTGGGIFSFQALAGATYSVSVYSFFDPSGTEIFDSQGVQVFLGAARRAAPVPASCRSRRPPPAPTTSSPTGRRGRTTPGTA